MLEIADIIGIIAFSISGFIIGVRERLDLLGVILSAFLTALGGGIIRDVLADRTIFAFSNFLAGTLVLIVLVLGFYFKLHKFDVENKTIFVLSDAIGLSSFSISGAIVGINAGFNIYGVVFLALITAVGGGMLRDMLINKIPFILREKFYATISILIGVFLYIFGTNVEILILTLIMGVIIRLIAYKKNWQLPKI
ncbi:trimeric intracellular cation channel family protein [Caminibacter pacificus]|jgi:uncharacterized membrane protein YeiH|uniref:Membrane protein YeiH n=1 Tax=Caminibacter pacificus TaxID=1424653 RepID=A0AAJ4UX83_9BACT|nr:trimeric intracellular cation channel family protein [Caminibacter pacificus]NPA87170.1 trimeric intracellular cation channel family protein [Campylobacterota bacterium]QCI29194.1 trimeric intracellular cation channel family protein [Caminibacter pacificus]ROR38838.1 putative membrane protein YeiH [Caminibacter pacificus]